jgi:uncharacterized RDD family membrane protein YckC|tara:strand:- start:257 stop:841 length:585 start_codon:yes stop_codon:yes gene_type:complete
VSTRFGTEGINPAGRFRRLLASLFDTLVLIVVFVFFAFRGDIGYTSFIMALSNELPVIVEWTLWFTAIFFVINGVPLFTRGQTVGKWMLGLHIVDSETGHRPALEKLILYRYVVFILLANLVSWFYIPDTVVSATLPVIGQITLEGIPWPFPGTLLWVPVVDAAFIFSSSRRCLHDRLAGTIVVRKQGAWSTQD